MERCSGIAAGDGGDGMIDDLKLALNPAMDTALNNERNEELDDNTPFDKLREECGVMAIYNHPDAARMTYWGLYSLQHRGQESGVIASADGQNVHDIKGMGLVSEIFTDDVLMR